MAHIAINHTFSTVMHLNYSPYGVTASVLASIVLMSFITFARADDKKLVMLAKGTLIEIQLSFDKCYLTMKEVDLFYRFGEIAKSKSTIDELFRCVENAPTKVKSSVDALRSALANKPQALAALKEYVLTYRRLLAKLGSPSTTLREASIYSAVLDGKGAEVIAEISVVSRSAAMAPFLGAVAL